MDNRRDMFFLALEIAANFIVSVGIIGGLVALKILVDPAF
jgi:hypothetical protein